VNWSGHNLIWGTIPDLLGGTEENHWTCTIWTACSVGPLNTKQECWLLDCDVSQFSTFLLLMAASLWATGCKSGTVVYSVWCWSIGHDMFCWMTLSVAKIAQRTWWVNGRLWNIGGMRLTEENWSMCGKTYPSAPLFTTNPLSYIRCNNYPYEWGSILLEKVTVAQLGKKFHTIMELTGPCHGSYYLFLRGFYF
jgi:hypothetical protein